MKYESNTVAVSPLFIPPVKNVVMSFSEAVAYVKRFTGIESVDYVRNCLARAVARHELVEIARGGEVCWTLPHDTVRLLETKRQAEIENSRCFSKKASQQ